MKQRENHAFLLCAVQEAPTPPAQGCRTAGPKKPRAGFVGILLDSIAGYRTPTAMNHRRLLRFALLMWAVPPAVAAVLLSGFVFLHGAAFAADDTSWRIAGALCVAAGIGAIIAIFVTENTARETPRRNYHARALLVLVLLLGNILLAAGYASLIRTLREANPIQRAYSPSGHTLAEVLMLDARDQPPYGLGVTLRPTPGRFINISRTTVFSAYCLKGPTIVWQDENRLLIHCEGAQRVARQLDRYRDIELRYRITATPPDRPVR